jgi:hypothetical protein
MGQVTERGKPLSPIKSAQPDALTLEKVMIRTTLFSILSASLIACGGGDPEPEMVHCPQIFRASYIVEFDGNEILLTSQNQSIMSDDELAEIGFLQAERLGLEGAVHVGDWCQDE